MSGTESLTLEDNVRIEKSIGVREQIVATLTKDKMPTDPETLNILLKTLDGVDRTILGRAKLRSDDEANKSNADISNQLTNLLRSYSPGRDKVKRQKAAMLSEGASQIETVPGEKELGNVQLAVGDLKRKPVIEE